MQISRIASRENLGEQRDNVRLILFDDLAKAHRVFLAGGAFIPQ
jgi:hypothetical protein